jgi:prepilin-type processing-associated H-X9-DG protein
MPIDETRPSRPDASAFTRFDLVAVLAVLAILIALQLPSLAHTRRASNNAICLNNHQQLTRAWRMYAEDNGDKLAGNTGGSSALNSNLTWCVGWLDNSAFRPDNTNTLYLLNAQLGRYTRTASVYKCPEDLSVSPRTTVPRVRSVSMNGYLGTSGFPYTSGYRVFNSFAEITPLKPVQTFVFIDEQQDSINDGRFLVEMGGYYPPNPSQLRMVDYPAAYHSGGAGVGFADGHAEIRLWVDARTMPVLSFGQSLPLNQPSPNNRDVMWLQERTTRRVSP